MYRPLCDPHVYGPPALHWQLMQQWGYGDNATSWGLSAFFFVILLLLFLGMFTSTNVFWVDLGGQEGGVLLYVVLVLLVLGCVGWAVYSSVRWDQDSVKRSTGA